MKNEYLQLKNIAKSFGVGSNRSSVLRNVSFDFYPHKSYAITGSSGSGKTTLLHIMAGLDTADSGSITMDNKQVHALSSLEQQELYSRFLGIVFQQPYLINELSVVENVMLKGLVAGLDATWCLEQAHAMLRGVGLADKAHSAPFSLSGGQQQRVAILRALFNRPTFLLADEPTGSLDVRTGHEVIDFLLACQQEWGMGLIVCSHDEYVVARMQHQVILEGGVLQPC